MSPIHCFPPVAGRGARLLILGSMPGRASLAARQYYAHPRNLFWPLLTDILGGNPELPYPARLRLLKTNGLALWDVLRSCVRAGSSDSEIKNSSITPNDLAAFFRTHPRIMKVLFNGAKARECYKKYILPRLPVSCAELEYSLLPSTSPAHASLSYAEKREAWKAAITAGYF